MDEVRRSIDENLHKDFPYSDGQKCEVHLEYSADRRKIDIVLEMRGNLWIGIENKPWADEQRNQIKDYMKYLRSKAKRPDGGAAWLVYLSGDGSDPTTVSGEEKERCLTMPYRTRDGKPPSLETWIRKCWRECEAERVRWFLEDLHGYIEKNFQLADVPGTQWGENGS